MKYLFVYLVFLYICTSLGTGTFYYSDWDNVGSTVFYITAILGLIIWLIFTLLYKVVEKFLEHLEDGNSLGI